MSKYTTPPGYFSNVWARISELISIQPMPSELTLPHKSLIPFIHAIYAADKQELPKITISDPVGLVIDEFPKYKLKKDKRVLLAYSGGKDSITMATKLRKQGLDVTAVFIQGINRSAKDEKQACIDTCAFLNIPMVIIPLKISSFTDRLESPAKNILVVAMMLDYGGPLGIGQYALGNEAEDKDVDSAVFYDPDIQFSDSPKVLELGCAIFKELKHFKLHHSQIEPWCYESYRTVFSYKNGMKLLGLSRSCMSQFQYRAKLNMVNAAKHWVDILPGRCGSCYKCCVEYMFLDAMKLVKPNAAYKRHCERFLRKDTMETALPRILSVLERASEEAKK